MASRSIRGSIGSRAKATRGRFARTERWGSGVADGAETETADPIGRRGTEGRDAGADTWMRPGRRGTRSDDGGEGSMTQGEMFGAPGSGSSEEARREVEGCRRCDLWRTGGRAVFGSGAPAARLMLVGEAPAEADQRTGEPFSGPSGALLDTWLAELGLDPAAVWLTNVVKHRPTIREGGRERNRPPRAGEAKACRVWLDLELLRVQPELIVALGGTAGKVLLGASFKITQGRGTIQPGPGGVPVIATFHPAYILRLEPPELGDAELLVRQDLDVVRQTLERDGR